MSKQNYCIPFSKVETVVESFADPHYNSFIDLNGDCKSDLFLVSKNQKEQNYLEIYLKQIDGTFCLVEFSLFQFKLKGISFGDFS